MAPNTKNTRILRAKHIVKGQGITLDLFKSDVVEVDATLKENEVLIRTLYLALDPYIRYSFNPENGPGSALNGTVAGVGVGEIIESKNSAFPKSSIVLGVGFSWEEYTKITGPALQTFIIIPEARTHPKIALTQYLNVLGINGLTAFASILANNVNFKKGQVVYVSSAAGPVGAFLAIWAKREGAYVIGSAGSDEKVQYLLKDLGIDAAFNYKTQDTRAELSKYAKDGLDIYFDLVQGETLDIALEHLKLNGQVIALGNISESNAKVPYVTKNLGLIIRKALTVKGFTGYQHLDKFPLLWEKVGPLIGNGEFPAQKETAIKGLEHAPQAFVDYLDGKYHGKVFVEVATL